MTFVAYQKCLCPDIDLFLEIALFERRRNVGVNMTSLRGLRDRSGKGCVGGACGRTGTRHNGKSKNRSRVFDNLAFQ